MLKCFSLLSRIRHIIVVVAKEMTAQGQLGAGGGVLGGAMPLAAWCFRVGSNGNGGGRVLVVGMVLLGGVNDVNVNGVFL